MFLYFTGILLTPFLLWSTNLLGAYFRSCCWGFNKNKNIEQQWWKGNAGIKQSDYNWEKNDKNSEVILAWQKMIIYFLGHFLLLMA